MRFFCWNSGWTTALFLLMNLHFIDSHMLHYLHLKKFLTAVAFARALGKRPTILPIPVPIPIPIAQNEVIKLPITGGGKTMIIDGSKGGDNRGAGVSHLLGGGYGGGVSHLLGGGSGAGVSHLLGGGSGATVSHSLGGGSGSDFTGSSSYGYSLPGISNPSVINLSSMKGSDSNTIASLLGGNSNSGSPRILILGGQNSDNILSSMGAMGGNPSILRLGDLGSSNIRFGTNGMNLGINGLNPGGIGLNNAATGINSFGQNGMNFGGNFADLDSAFSLKSPNIFHVPNNVYSDKPRRKLPFKFRGRRIHNNNYKLHSGTEFNNNKYKDKNDNNFQKPSSHEEQNNNPNMYKSSQERYKKPIPVGEKFGYRP